MTKIATEVNCATKNCVLPFTVAKIHQEYAKCIKSHQWLQTDQCMGVTVIISSAINPSAKGMAKCEVNLKKKKTMIKKFVAANSIDLYNWEMLCYMRSKVINYSASMISGIMPAHMLYNTEYEGTNFLQSNAIALPQYSVKQIAFQLKRFHKK